MKYLALTSLETSLSLYHFRAKAQIRQEFKNESKKEVLLWRFMEDFGLECYTLRDHNSF